ncbi:hypothetical protein Y09_1519 [Brachybacterium sp. SW0106-09]|nr:hypothetical protein Y09_1519 [Brachybacterium sp. SW0106-09]
MACSCSDLLAEGTQAVDAPDVTTLPGGPPPAPVVWGPA